MAENYRIVTGTVVFIGPNSITVDTPNGRKPVAYSLMHGGDALAFDKMPHGPVEPFKHTFRCMSWKAEEVGLA